MTFKYRYRKQIIICLLILLCLGGGGTFFFLKIKNKPKSKTKDIVISNKIEKEKKNSPTLKNKKTITNEIMVDVKGFVNQPGIYKLEDGSRVIDAIQLAGGVTNEADMSVLNLSKKIKDEMVIIVYSYEQVNQFKQVKEEENKINEDCQLGLNEIKNDACIDTSSEPEMSNNSKVISINSATLEELMQLEGVGEAKAKAIIEYRQKNGLFQKIEDLLNVNGIGESLLAKIKENITL